MRRVLRGTLIKALNRSGLLWSPKLHPFGKDDRERFCILVYHRVVDSPKPDFLPDLLNCQLSVFRDHLAVLHRNFSVLALDEAVLRIQEGKKLPPRTVVLTFDDAWRENMETVVEPLVEAKLPATFFIDVGVLDSKELHPNHLFYYLFCQAGPEAVISALRSMFPLVSSSLPPLGSPAKHFRLWLEGMLNEPLTSEAGAATMDAVSRELNVPSSSGMGSELYMTADDVRSLPSYHIQVGNHTVHHPRLASLDEAGQRRELADAQLALSDLIGQPVTTLAYPYGLSSDFNQTSVRLAAELGHSCACTVKKGYNDGQTDAMQLRRMSFALHTGQELAFELLWRGVAVRDA